MSFKTYTTIALLSFISLTSFGQSHLEVSGLQGAKILAKEMKKNDFYREILVEVNGKKYPVCRYSNHMLDKILCANPKRPHSWVISRQLGMFETKDGARIHENKTVSIEKCYNDLVYKSLECSDEQY